MCVCGGVGGDGNACQNMHVETRRKYVGVGCLLPQCGSWDWNSSPQAWQQDQDPVSCPTSSFRNVEVDIKTSKNYSKY